MADTFKLPASSYDELIKIIQAYATGKVGQAFTLEDLAKASGMVTTQISRNNGFLIDLDLITAGKAKSPTETCIKLGRAYTHRISDDVVNIWREIIENNEFLKRMISALRIRNGMDKVNFINHVIYSSGLDSNANTKAGAGAVLEILKLAGFIEDKDGRIIAPIIDSYELKKEPDSSNLDIAPAKNTDEKAQSFCIPVSKSQSSCQIMLNLNLSGSIEDLDELASKVKKFIEELTI